MRLVVLGTAVAVCLSSVWVFAAIGVVEASPQSPSAALHAADSQYLVTFTESGLPSGTNWSITMSDETQNSTNVSIVFTEPDGQYAFMVGSVVGYTVGPEGNLTIAGAPLTVSILFTKNVPSEECTSFVWAGKNNRLTGNCLGFFETEYSALNASTGFLNVGNSTFTVGPIAEVTPAGAVVALATPGFQGFGSVTVVPTPDEVNVTDNITGNVSNAVGLNSSSGLPNGQVPLWTPADAPGGGGGTSWGRGTQVLGSTAIRVEFHFENDSSSASSRVEFVVTVSGWPWVSPGDALGLEVSTAAVAGAHLQYTASNDTITQRLDSNESVVSSIIFGATANVSGKVYSTLTVTDQVGLLPSGSAPVEAFALLTFQGLGGYTNLTYDPWVVFGTVAGSTVVTPPILVGGAELPLVAVGAISLGAVLLGVVAYRTRRRPVDEGLAPREPGYWPSGGSVGLLSNRG
jgi:hypothetical protein